MVTGAAPRGDGMGNGKAMALLIAREGAKVLLVNRSAERAEALAAEIAEEGGEASVFAADVTQSDEVAAMGRAVQERYGRLDILCNNVGVGAGSGPNRVEDVSDEAWLNLVHVNMTSAMLCSRAAVPLMRDSGGGGSIINVSSMAGKASWPNSAEYSATKSGVIGVTRSAAMELGPHGITVNAVCPGNTLTAMVRRVAAEIGATLDMTGDRWLAMRAEDTALKRLAEPEEIAGVIAFLASDDARYITGQSIGVDGGLILS